MQSIAKRIAEELSVKISQVEAAIALLDEGSTVPFIARYRKEATGGLTDTHLRDLHERLGTLRDLEARRVTILGALKEMGKLTPELERSVLGAQTRTRLEDLYLPYRPKRHTKASKAREAGLEPLAMALLDNPQNAPEKAAAAFVNADKGVADVQGALDGARDILIEVMGEDADLIQRLREIAWSQGTLRSQVVKGKEQEGAKYADYFDFSQPVASLPSHRILAILRGHKEGMLRHSMALKGDDETPANRLNPSESEIASRFRVRNQGRPGDAWLLDTVRQAWRKKIRANIESDQVKRLMEAAHIEAIRVFAGNLRDLLLAAPAGAVSVLGLDPGLRTGVKVAVVDATGKVATTGVIYPHAPQNRWRESLDQLARWAQTFHVKLVSIGNGTASRETAKLVSELARLRPELGIVSVIVNEAGASVYSASAFAAQELPDMDVSLRGAVSIARRLQDPLAELVKIEPQAIGVGQYQHDVDAKRLANSLTGVVEDAVNAVGVEVNTASAPLLECVSGLSSTLAQNIVDFRDANGPFKSRKQLLKVARFGPKAFEQAAGFLRIRNGATPLDNSAVHPESYSLVERIVDKTGMSLKQIIGNREVLGNLRPADFVDGQFGEPTVRDILAELEKPGRDPCPEFRTANLREGVEAITDLKPGMILEGTVTNVTNFGAFDRKARALPCWARASSPHGYWLWKRNPAHPINRASYNQS
ncbi:Tex family protein [Magnetofaba australis]|uniref:Putative RNA-binding S1 domain-containing protein n=1 Tax=Magnetofaba australis IT-1 TaxID=1434232 RepID=A0A1Y2KAB3_9PROT|nr:Tex family protein [Magnetofaba australis]OSM08770.1 putative RNA-binding S1 domain-containing protein [Magnetofaba australis IT-1]